MIRKLLHHYNFWKKSRSSTYLNLFSLLCEKNKKEFLKLQKFFILWMERIISFSAVMICELYSK
jgi:hypothetical protein